MSDVEIKFGEHPIREVFRWDADGNLVHIHPTIVQGVYEQANAHKLDIDSLLASMQRTCVDLGARVIKLEGEGASLREALAQLIDKKAPASAVEHAPFGSVAKLVKTIEGMFDCRNGDPRAWHEEWVSGDQHVGYRRHQYIAFTLIAPSSMEDAQERLRQMFYTAFHRLKRTCKSPRPVLYWRYAAEERIQEELGVSERIGNSFKIRTRVAIPEADFSVVNEIVQADGMPARVLEV